MKLLHFQELTQSWKNKIKHRRNRSDGKREPSGSQPCTLDLKGQRSSDHPARSTKLAGRVEGSGIRDRITEEASIQEQLISELPFHDEETIPTTAGVKLIEFQPFPRLPPELRNKIWQHACFIGRNVEVKSWNYGSYIAIPTLDNHTENPWQVWIYRSNTVPPAVLSISSESRAIGLKHYQLDWGTNYAFRGFTFSTPATIYVNYDSDRIVMTQTFQSSDIEDCVDFLDRCFRKVKFLALNVKDNGRHECPYLRPFLKRVMKDHADSSLEDIILFGRKQSTTWPGKRIDFKMLPKDWTTTKDDCFVILKRTRIWVRQQLLPRRARGKADINLVRAPKLHFRHFSEGAKRY